MNLLITGAAGFIGSNFVFYQLQNHPKDRITVLDSLTYAGNPETLRGVADQIQFHKIDISDETAVNALFQAEHFDLVVNFAAESHVDHSIAQPGLFVKTNVLGTQVLLEACRSHGKVRYHQVSTDEVYGDLPLDRPDLTFDESTPIRTSSPYSASKAAADLLTLAYGRTYGLPITISRCSNNYGPYQFPEKLIPLTILNALDGNPIRVYGNGLNRRDWIHVEDHCRAIDLILRKGRIGELYNVGGCEERSNLEVVRAILSEVGASEDLIEFVRDRPGHDLRYAINPRKIQTELGWSAQTDFTQGLKDTVRWYREHPEWWKAILGGTYQSGPPL